MKQLPTRIHFVGIGGIGLSAIARVLLERGHVISGSDLHLSPVARELARQGATVYEGHAAEHVGDADLVVVSSAIPPHNPERLAARQRGIPVVKRHWLLERLTAGTTCIAVAGTHGKTTTSAMIAWTLVQAGLDPTFIVGGVVQNLGTNARSGQGDVFVIEADEYDHTFLSLHPRIAVVTHLEHDHPDCYPTFREMRAAFREFVELVPEEGVVVGCGDEEAVAGLLEEAGQAGKSVLSYGLANGRDWRATAVRPNERGGYDFTVEVQHRDAGLQVSLQIPGLHNVKNALGVLAAVAQVGVPVEEAARALSQYQGTERRFQVKGEAGGVVVVDDYAHHPTEIRATLRAARDRYPGRTLWAVFQPHTYSRTKALFENFAAAFADADHVLLVPIYPAREHDTLGMSSQKLVARIRERGHPDARYVPSLAAAVETLLEELRPGDVLLTLGAGDGYVVGEEVLGRLVDW